ncbi:Asp-tRNA(Asn)/Glu-tRNA(Gln) amidotransferase subunit GatC [Brackiella oedipodis]|uniref:Asp-tRNA(Asn)/Glu-tRNA(Gln) amidotransferase subunit GatC n=1 Tax=Brackiella oedipodis TaxID=124225 RepID=UPI00048FCC09|nr:Asp-tRNA(Asn)/Glu-tRNA(Gln) amidotransferase subunit GatC [Brackiella oedipodis]
MSLTTQEVQHIARLSRLDLNADEQAQSRDELNRLLALIDELQAVDTRGIEPLAHPLSVLEQVQLRLREDDVTAESGEQVRDQLMRNAPASSQGLFLVPKVVE